MTLGAALLVTLGAAYLVTLGAALLVTLGAAFLVTLGAAYLVTLGAAFLVVQCFSQFCLLLHPEFLFWAFKNSAVQQGVSSKRIAYILGLLVRLYFLTLVALYMYMVYSIVATIQSTPFFP